MERLKMKNLLTFLRKCAKLILYSILSVPYLIFIITIIVTSFYYYLDLFKGAPNA